MLDNINLFHDHSSLEDIKVSRKNFSLRLETVEKVNKYQYKIQIERTISQDPEHSDKFIIFKFIDIKIIGEIADAETELGAFSMVYTFKFSNIKNFITTSAKGIAITDELDEWFDNVVLATTRGFMYSELRGSYLDGVVFPLLKPKDLQKPV